MRHIRLRDAVPAGDLLVHPRAAAALADAGLASSQALLDVAGKVFSDRPSTLVKRVEAPGLPPIYVKLNRRVKLKNTLRALWQRGAWLSAAAVEWANLVDLAEVGLETPLPLALASELTLRGERWSVLVTRELDGLVCLDDLIDDFGADDRRRALHGVAEVLAGIHEAGLVHPDIYARHVYADPALERWAVMDVQRTRRYRRVPSAARVRDLAALDVSLSIARVSERERLRLFVRYARRCGLRRRVWRSITRSTRARREKMVRRGRGPETHGNHSGPRAKAD